MIHEQHPQSSAILTDSQGDQSGGHSDETDPVERDSTHATEPKSLEPIVKPEDFDETTAVLTPIAPKETPKTTLTLVGTGIKTISHLTVETKAHIHGADRVFYLLNEPIMQQWVQREKPDALSLEPLYWKYPRRRVCYEAITTYLLWILYTYGGHITVVFYGHPSVFAQSGLEAVRRARAAGYDAKILPSVSAEDCLFADLEVDPSEGGCQSFDATDFLVRKRTFDPTTQLILWQIGCVGLIGHETEMRPGALQVLTDYLFLQYPEDHLITLYEGAQYPTQEPKVIRFPLRELPQQTPSRIMTLYIPPVRKKELCQDMIQALGIVLES
jgi:uncharacterized protein YabN with tetrapyrrole methylase and pyrophosphatase domain